MFFGPLLVILTLTSLFFRNLFWLVPYVIPVFNLSYIFSLPFPSVLICANPSIFPGFGVSGATCFCQAQYFCGGSCKVPVSFSSDARHQGDTSNWPRFTTQRFFIVNLYLMLVLFLTIFTN